MGHVKEVVADALVKVDGVAAVDLRQTGQAGADAVADGQLFGRAVTRTVFGRKWPWPHKRHIALNHVNQLGQFVQRGFSKKLAESRGAVFVG